MTLALLSEKSKVELLHKESVKVHFGMISIDMPISDLFAISSMVTIQHSSLEDCSIEDVCSVIQLEDKRFMLCYRTLSMVLCGGALSQFVKLIGEATKEYQLLFEPHKEECLALERAKEQAYQDSLNDITTIISSIEKEIGEL